MFRVHVPKEKKKIILLMEKFIKLDEPGYIYIYIIYLTKFKNST